MGRVVRTAIEKIADRTKGTEETQRTEEPEGAP